MTVRSARTDVILTLADLLAENKAASESEDGPFLNGYHEGGVIEAIAWLSLEAEANSAGPES